MAYSAVVSAHMVVGLSPKSPPVQVHGLKRLRCHADLCTVSRCHTRGESEDHKVRKYAKGIHPGFETQGRHHPKSKTGILVAAQKGLMSSRNVFKKKFTGPFRVTRSVTSAAMTQVIMEERSFEQLCKFAIVKEYKSS